MKAIKGQKLKKVYFYQLLLHNQSYMRLKIPEVLYRMWLKKTEIMTLILLAIFIYVYNQIHLLKMMSVI